MPTPESEINCTESSMGGYAVNFYKNKRKKLDSVQRQSCVELCVRSTSLCEYGSMAIHFCNLCLIYLGHMPRTAVPFSWTTKSFAIMFLGEK